MFPTRSLLQTFDHFIYLEKYKKKIQKTEPRMDRGCLLLIKVIYYFEVLWQWTIPWIIQWTIQGRLIRRGTYFRVLFSWDDGSHIRALGCNRTCYFVGSEVNVTKFHFFAWEVTAANKFDCHGSCRTSSNVLEAHFTNLNFRRNLKIKMRQQISINGLFVKVVVTKSIKALRMRSIPANCTDSTDNTLDLLE